MAKRTRGLTADTPRFGSHRGRCASRCNGCCVPAPRTIPTTGPGRPGLLRVLEVSDDIVALPSGGRITVTSIDTPDGSVLRATTGQSITVLLVDKIDAGRGEVLAHPTLAPRVVTELDADLCWLADAPLRVGARVLVKHGTRTVRAIVTALTCRLDLHTVRHGAQVQP